MTERVEDLNGVKGILWAARMDAVCDQWHLDHRALPALKLHAEKAGEPRLHQAAEEVTKASERFDAARDALRGAIGLVEACAPEPVREGEPGAS
jgi:hypothetical protein